MLNEVYPKSTGIFFYVLLTVHLSISLDIDQRDAHLVYFTIRPLQSSTCFEHYMLIIRILNCIDAASSIVLSVSGRPVHRTATDWEWRYQVLHQYISTSWWWAYNALNMWRIVVDVLYNKPSVHQVGHCLSLVLEYVIWAGYNWQSYLQNLRCRLYTVQKWPKLNEANI